MITGGIDRDLFLQESDLDVMRLVEDQVAKSVTAGDPSSAFRLGRTLRKGMQVQGLALVSLLYQMNKSWALFEAAGIEDKFEDVVNTELGLAPSTTRKYIMMWEAIFDNPEVDPEIKKGLMSKPLKSLLMLTASAKEGSINWRAAVDATDPVELREVIQDARGMATSAGTRLILTLDIRDGSLAARRGDGVPVHVGWLDVLAEDQDVKDAIHRIVSSAGIMET